MPQEDEKTGGGAVHTDKETDLDAQYHEMIRAKKRLVIQPNGLAHISYKQVGTYSHAALKAGRSRLKTVYTEMYELCISTSPGS